MILSMNCVIMLVFPPDFFLCRLVKHCKGHHGHSCLLWENGRHTAMLWMMWVASRLSFIWSLSCQYRQLTPTMSLNYFLYLPSILFVTIIYQTLWITSARSSWLLIMLKCYAEEAEKLLWFASSVVQPHSHVLLGLFILLQVLKYSIFKLWSYSSYSCMALVDQNNQIAVLVRYQVSSTFCEYIRTNMYVFIYLFACWFVCLFICFFRDIDATSSHVGCMYPHKKYVFSGPISLLWQWEGGIKASERYEIGTVC